MSTPEQFPQGSSYTSDDQATRGGTDPQRRTITRRRRFEVGFFVRKIVDGRLVFYKEVPSYGRKTFAVPRRLEAGAPAPTASLKSSEQGSQRVAMKSSGDEESSLGDGDTTFEPLSGTGEGSGDGGPVGSSTRIELGLFAGTTTTTETTSGDEDEPI